MIKGLFVALALASLFLSPALALFLGVIFALIFGSVFESYIGKLSSLLLKIAIVGLGFGMNLIDSLQSSADGIAFTIFSVVLVMIAGVFLGRCMGLDQRVGYLIASGTAICGGSAIAAVSPVIKADANSTSMSLAVVFILNAIAMLLFPSIGQMLDLTQTEFGVWSAIAIHDTSAVVGAAKIFGEDALRVATTVKLSRALWIIPLSLVSAFIFRKETGGESGRISIPWFILLFIAAMIINTYLPIGKIPAEIIKETSHKLLGLTLFLIGSKLSFSTIRVAGIKPILLGVILWLLISGVSLGVIFITR